MKFFIVFLLAIQLISVKTYADDAIIIDSRHYSNVFGEIRNFRIFLPPNYYKNATKKYPVIYFFHGWGQRYFGEGSDEYAGYDSGEQNKGDNIANFVAKHDVIVVKADGYNRRQDEEYYRRPYNVLPVETYRQFPLYFPELVTYIDEHFRTIADRQHRAISGLSMGGFMTFMIAAKYPDMVSSAGSFCGAPEFTIGPFDFPVEYKHMYMYRNLDGINVRLHFGDKDFIRSYHFDMNRMWTQVMNNYSWKIYDAEHSTCGLADMFNSFIKTFDNPMSLPQRWDHTEVYPDFTVWNYKISSDRTVPGFTVIENANKRGFRIAVREYVPDGQLIQQVNVQVTTAPLYERNQQYTINDVDLFSGKVMQSTVVSDNEGTLVIAVNGSQHEIGINKKSDKPEITALKYEISDAEWPQHGRDVRLSIPLLNKGMSVAKNVSATISAFRNNVTISKSTVSYGNIAVNEKATGNGEFIFSSSVDSVDVIKFRVDMQDGDKNKWTQFIDVPILKRVDAFANIEIADGRTVNVASSGIDVQPVMLGRGNGDGAANPGESVVVLVRDSGKLWRTDLTFADKFLNPRGLNSRKSEWWTDMDHVGASAKYDELLIAADCPADHHINAFAEYWVPQYPMHIPKQGTIGFTVTGVDKTPPYMPYIQYRSDNTIEARIVDGGKIKKAAARLNLQYELVKSFEVELHDDGLNGDRTAGDNVFSAQLPNQKFRVYRVVVTATDESGNGFSQEGKGWFVAH
jgi:S-formylglutathione hydrolase FrmB